MRNNRWNSLDCVIITHLFSSFFYKCFYLYADFRLYINNNYPYVLDTFYKFGDLMGSDSAQIRKIDAAYWEQTAATAAAKPSSTSSST